MSAGAGAVKAAAGQPLVRQLQASGPPARWAAADHVRRGWHVMFAVQVSLVVVLAWSGAGPVERALLLAGTALLVGAHLRWGLPALGNGDGAGRYAVASVVAVGLVACADDSVVLLLIAVVPQLYWVLPLRQALLAAGALFAVVGASFLLHRGIGPPQLLEALLVTAGGFALSTLVAAWLARVLIESEARVHLIRELEATRQQLAGADYEAGVLQERTRLAGEIHDSLAQGFASIQMLLLSVERDLGASQHDRALERVRLAREQASRHVEESRSIIAYLGPVDLRRGDLVADLHDLVAGVARELDVRACFEVDGEPVAVPQQLQVVLLRVLQESLANVRKHAHAQTVRVRLAFCPDSSVVLTVEDDGTGFDLARSTGGFGLPGLQRRARDAGGRLHLRSAPGSGTAVRLELPLPGAAATGG